MLQIIDIHLPVPGLLLMLVSDGRVIVEPSQFNFEPEYHYSQEDINVFGADGYSLSDADGVLQHYEYGTAYPYKQMPALKRWLIEQQLTKG